MSHQIGSFQIKVRFSSPVIVMLLLNKARFSFTLHVWVLAFRIVRLETFA